MESDDTNLTAEQQPTDTDSDGGGTSFLERIACLENELLQKEERILRLRADFENYRKRMQREMPVILTREKEQHNYNG